MNITFLWFQWQIPIGKYFSSVFKFHVSHKVCLHVFSNNADMSQRTCRHQIYNYLTGCPSFIFRMLNRTCATNQPVKMWNPWNLWNTPWFSIEHVKWIKENKNEKKITSVSSQNLLKTFDKSRTPMALT